jgi:DNA-binding NtrC family response regulator
VEVDVRVVAASSEDLRPAVEAGRFLPELFERLAAVSVSLPPLRQRREDLPLLVESILERLSVELERPPKGVSGEAMAALLGHAWPGNLRELRNVLERGAAVETGPVIQAMDLGLKEPAGGSGGPLPSLEEVERRHVSAVLSHTGGNVSQSARILGIDRVTLYNKMRKWSLRRDGEPVPAKGEG